jgi:hypothetical protein
MDKANHLSNNRQEWVATYIDGQYYLTDMFSVNRLKQLEREIEI